MDRIKRMLLKWLELKNDARDLPCEVKPAEKSLRVFHYVIAIVLTVIAIILGFFSGFYI